MHASLWHADLHLWASLELDKMLTLAQRRQFHKATNEPAFGVRTAQVPSYCKQDKRCPIAKLAHLPFTHTQIPEHVHAPFRIGALARLATPALEELSVSNMHLLHLAHAFVLCDEEWNHC